MKTTLKASLVVLILISLYLLTTGNTYENSSTKHLAYIPAPQNNKFIYGAFNSGYDFQFEYDELGFNIWHT